MTSLNFQTYRLQLVRDEAPAKELPAMSAPPDAARRLQPLFAELDREHFVVLALDARNQPIGANTVSIGSLSASIVHPREVFKFAVLANAASVILAHNHPSGQLDPSRDDIELTRRLSEAGKIMGIDVLDHLILGPNDFLSFREKGIL